MLAALLSQPKPELWPLWLVPNVRQYCPLSQITSEYLQNTRGSEEGSKLWAASFLEHCHCCHSDAASQVCEISQQSCKYFHSASWHFQGSGQRSNEVSYGLWIQNWLQETGINESKQLKTYRRRNHFWNYANTSGKQKLFLLRHLQIANITHLKRQHPAQHLRDCLRPSLLPTTGTT